MAFNLKEMNREGFDIPVLIGGATTSRIHTAVKLDQHYPHPVVHVSDASLAVEVCGNLSGSKSDQQRKTIKSEYKKLREGYASRARADEVIPLEEARKKAFKTDWNNVDIASPEKKGVFEVNVDLKEVAEVIDWSPFFWAWEMKGKFPKIFQDPRYGDEAKQLHEDALKMLEQMIQSRNIQPKALVGIFEAYSHDESVSILSSEGKVLEVFDFLRQRRASGITQHCLADYIAPQEIDRKDYLGLFAVTAGSQIGHMASQYEKENDDYNAILVKALGDRFAEALAELTHKKVREIFGFGKTEDLSIEDIVDEQYRGIRPAPGYPACPVHSEKSKIWKVLGVEKRIGIQLTENFAMNPPSSVSGYYFNHPQAKYFTVK